MVITEVTLTDGNSRGIESFGISYDENNEILFNINDGNSQPVIGTGEAVSFVSVKSGEMIILGGLQENALRNVKGEMAFLGDIPFLGLTLFKSDREATTRRELVVFIRPIVYFGENDSHLTICTKL